MSESSLLWACGEIRVSTEDGWKSIPGWVRGNFGLDFRCMWDRKEDAPNGIVCWSITHLPTGHAVLSMAAQIDEVQAVVEEIEGYADWSVVTLENAGALRSRFDALKRRLGVKAYLTADMVPPWSFTEFVPVRGGGKPKLRLVT
jgi:hypothetical protein